jgi:hypothetical protein
MHALRIIALCVAAAVTYGVLHDQITSRVCVEYFTVGHPPVFGTEDPTLLALGWALASAGAVVLVEPLASRVPREKHAAFLADLWAHSASYLIGFVGGLLVCVRVWRSRRGPAE